MTKEDPKPGSDDELLRQWDERIRSAGDPLRALADVLGGRAKNRAALFAKVGEVVLGCRLQRILGAGGMGVTYAATADQGAAVAVKLVSGIGNGARERFEQECRLLRSLAHPAIVRYRDHAVLDDGTGVLVMDLVDGGDLERLLADVVGDMPPDSVAAQFVDARECVADRLASPRYQRRMLRLLATVAEGLHAAHVAGIVHRDVKPANVLLRPDLEPVLIDFGLARDQQVRVSFTASGAAMGTLAYMAPEQLGSDPGAVGPRTDVYAMGLILFRALLGEEPRTDARAVLQWSRRPFLLASRHARVLPVNVQAILYRCLELRPERRYASCRELTEDLRAAAGQGTVRARRPSGVRRLVRDGRRFAATTAMIVLFVAMGIAWAWPQGRWVVFAANCRAADATVEAGGVTARLGVRVWLPYGSHTAVIEGEKIDRATRTFELAPGIGDDRIPLTVQSSDGPGRSAPHRRVVQFTTGHSRSELQPGVGVDRREYDRRVIDGEEANGVFILGGLVPGPHALRATDGLSRTEVQPIDVGDQPLDVQLLPAVMAHVAGAFRRTWSTVVSPLPPDVTWRGAAEPWLALAQSHTFAGNGVLAAECALVAGDAHRAVDVELHCTFPEPMRSAVVWWRGDQDHGGGLDVEAGFEGELLQPWPAEAIDRAGAMREYCSEGGARGFVVRARLWSEVVPTNELALSRFLYGVVFGGHWRDQPPCFAIVADPGHAARVPPTTAGDDPTAARRIVADGIDIALSGDKKVSSLEVLPGPGGVLHLLTTALSANASRPEVLRLRWPDGEVMGRWSPEQLHPRSDARDGSGFGRWIAIGSDVDGDGFGDVAIGDQTSKRLGDPNSGTVGLLRSGTGACAWLWPLQPSAAPFRDDNAGMVFPAGDWNKDGTIDFAVAAPEATADGQVKAGIVEVLNGRTGVQEWTWKRVRAYTRATVLDSFVHDSAAADLLLKTSRYDSSDQVDSFDLWLWTGGNDGREVRGPLLPREAAAVLLGDVRGAVPFLVVLRTGRMTDGFVGLERFDVTDGRLELVGRVPLAASGFEVREHPVRLGDIDGDGVLDAAFLLKAPSSTTGVLFVSGSDLRLLGFGTIDGEQIVDDVRPAWVPAVAGSPAQLVVCSQREAGGRGQLTLRGLTWR